MHCTPNALALTIYFTKYTFGVIILRCSEDFRINAYEMLFMVFQFLILRNRKLLIYIKMMEPNYSAQNETGEDK